MIKLALMLLAGLSAGIVATLAVVESQQPTTNVDLFAIAQSVRALDERVAALEVTAAAGGIVPGLPDAATTNSVATGAEIDAGVAEAPDAAEASAIPSRPASRRSREARRQRMAAEGLSAQTIDWIERRENEARWHETERLWDRQRQRFLDGETTARGPLDTLRSELSETDYEAYRRALGLPTSATVLSVVEGAPGSAAGLEPGDRIVRYDGQRLYDLADLRAYSVMGPRGETVVVDIERDGVPVQVALPRGPIGITVGGGR